MTDYESIKELNVQYLGDSMRMREAKSRGAECIEKVDKINYILSSWSRANDDAEEIIKRILDVL